MINDQRFFQEFFDGQVVKEETQNYKLFKVLLFSCFSAIGLFLVFAEFCSVAAFILLELGMFWNIYSNLENKVSILFSVAVAIIYFYFAIHAKLYANALIYIAAYIPLQMMAVSKDYSEGSFVQIKKKINDYNKILFIMFFVGILIVFTLFNYGVNGRLTIYDGLSASLLVCSAVLRNERYFEYYVFRIFALVMSIIVWLLVYVRYATDGSIAILCMYLSYLIFDVVTFFYQNKTYINQYMLEKERVKKLEEQELIDKKLKIYEEQQKANKPKTKAGEVVTKKKVAEKQSQEKTETIKKPVKKTTAKKVTKTAAKKTVKTETKKTK